MARHGQRRRSSAASVLSLLALTLVTRAHAESNADVGELELSWLSPPACDERQRTLDAVQRLLGASPRELATASLSASATVTRTANDAFHLLLLVKHGDQELSRKLEAASCEELSDAAALILALVLDPELMSRAPAAASEPAQSPPVQPSQVPAAESKPPNTAPPANIAQPRRARRPGPRLAPFIELGPVASWGVIPSPAFGVSLSGGFDVHSFRVSVTGVYLPAQHQSLPNTGASAAFELRMLAAALCFSPALSESFRLGPCLTSEFGSVAALGEGVDAPHGDTKRWAASGIGALLRFSSRRAFELGVQPALELPWGRPEFWLAGTQVHKPAWLNASLRAFVGVRF